MSIQSWFSLDGHLCTAISIWVILSTVDDEIFIHFLQLHIAKYL